MCWTRPENMCNILLRKFRAAKRAILVAFFSPGWRSKQVHVRKRRQKQNGLQKTWGKLEEIEPKFLINSTKNSRAAPKFEKSYYYIVVVSVVNDYEDMPPHNNNNISMMKIETHFSTCQHWLQRALSQGASSVVRAIHVNGCWLLRVLRRRLLRLKQGDFKEKRGCIYTTVRSLPGSRSSQAHQKERRMERWVGSSKQTSWSRNA